MPGSERAKPGTHQYVPTAGVRADFKRLMNTFLSQKTVRFEHFSEVWKLKMMPFIFACRSTDREAREFVERVFVIALEYFLPPYQFQVRVGGLYLLYALHQTQPLLPKTKIRLTLSQWEDSLQLQQEASQQNHLDVVYVFNRLIQEHAFQFCFTPEEMIHRGGRNKEPIDDGENLADDLKEEKSLLNNLFNYESMEQLSYLQSQYQQMKIGLAGPSATRPDKSLDVMQGELVEDLILMLQNFREKVSGVCKFGKKQEPSKETPDKQQAQSTGSRRQLLKQQAYQSVKTSPRKLTHRMHQPDDSDDEEETPTSPRKRRPTAGKQTKRKSTSEAGDSSPEKRRIPQPGDLSSFEDSDDDYVPPGIKRKSPVKVGKFGKMGIMKRKEVKRTPLPFKRKELSRKRFDNDDTDNRSESLPRGRPKKVAKTYDPSDELKKAYIEKRKKEGATVNLDDDDNSDELSSDLEQLPELPERSASPLEKRVEKERENVEIYVRPSGSEQSDKRNVEEQKTAASLKLDDETRRILRRSLGEDFKNLKVVTYEPKRTIQKPRTEPKEIVEIVYPKGKVINPFPCAKYGLDAAGIMAGVQASYRGRAVSNSSYEVQFGLSYARRKVSSCANTTTTFTTTESGSSLSRNKPEDSEQAQEESGLCLSLKNLEQKGKKKKSKAFTECLAQSRLVEVTDKEDENLRAILGQTDEPVDQTEEVESVPKETTGQQKNVLVALPSPRNIEESLKILPTTRKERKYPACGKRRQGSALTPGNAQVEAVIQELLSQSKNPTSQLSTSANNSETHNHGTVKTTLLNVATNHISGSVQQQSLQNESNVECNMERKEGNKQTESTEKMNRQTGSSVKGRMENGEGNMERRRNMQNGVSNMEIESFEEVNMQTGGSVEDNNKSGGSVQTNDKSNKEGSDKYTKGSERGSVNTEGSVEETSTVIRVPSAAKVLTLSQEEFENMNFSVLKETKQVPYNRIRRRVNHINAKSRLTDGPQFVYIPDEPGEASNKKVCRILVKSKHVNKPLDMDEVREILDNQGLGRIVSEESVSDVISGQNSRKRPEVVKNEPSGFDLLFKDDDCLYDADSGKTDEDEIDEVDRDQFNPDTKVITVQHGKGKAVMDYVVNSRRLSKYTKPKVDGNKQYDFLYL